VAREEAAPSTPATDQQVQILHSRPYNYDIQ